MDDSPSPSPPWYMLNGRRILDECIPPDWWFSKLLSHAMRKQTVLLSLLPRLMSAVSKADVWLTGGSLLGQWRHGGFVPHDDDLDFACWTDQLPIIEAAIADAFGRDNSNVMFANNSVWNGRSFANVTFFDHSTDLRVVVDFWCGRVSCPFLILLSFTHTHRYIDRNSSEDLAGSSTFEFPSQVLPLEVCEFSGIASVRRPRDSLAYLKRVYGANCLNECVVWGHQDNWSLCSVWRLTLADYMKCVKDSGYKTPNADANIVSLLDMKEL